MAASYLSTLTEAINDILEHGFDSQSRVAYWVTRLRETAESNLSTEAEMETRLKAALTQVFKRVSLARHPGADADIIRRLAPRLRNELDRRTMAARDLIRLSREEAVTKTLRRFAGWSTSIPVGGVPEVTRAAKKLEIKKPLASLPFEEWRVILDQSTKLAGALDSILAEEGGAIAGIWHSHWKQPGYNYRPDHKERDGKVYVLREGEAYQEGHITKGAGFTDTITAPGQEPNCRCKMTYLYRLHQLPPEMLTKRARLRVV